MRLSDDVSELLVGSILKEVPKRRRPTSSTHRVKTQKPINIIRIMVKAYRQVQLVGL